MEIWHNPRCAKSRAALAAVESSDQAHTVRRYLDEPPTEAELDEVLTKLGKDPWEITRLKEPLAKDLILATKPHNRADWIKTLAANPTLIERPIIITDNGSAIIARTPEAIHHALTK
ncbi:arsenate reductase family protein [Actinokineospora sp. NBRC 105648]|uniref:arsenate reductase family protein n=1 Tax=Actinokineospora sp. NBRC 105648 TaxID=3032206 RepID=UPI0024A0564D|nr:arsenate reductase family protein [Actinokineospora sp. NBRC 105648]GLZ43561.1 arsenate reductase [Actinokineospora sp. NBRC 105648]